MVMVDHCGLPYEKDEASTKLWKEGTVTMCVDYGVAELRAIIINYMHEVCAFFPPAPNTIPSHRPPPPLPPGPHVLVYKRELLNYY